MTPVTTPQLDLGVIQSHTFHVKPAEAIVTDDS